MGLFQKRIGPIFLKEESDSKEILEKLQSLSLKAKDEVKAEIEKQIKIVQYGRLGEQNIAFELKNSGIDMYILHDIYLEIGDLSAQIDYVIVTRKHVYIVECKNLIGNVEVDSSGGFVRTYEINGKKIKEGIYSPITQNQRHLQVIKEIGLNARKNIIAKTLYEKIFDDIYKSLVVLANPKTYLNAKYAKKEIKGKIIRADQLISKIQEMNAYSKNENWSEKEMKERAEAFLEMSKEHKSDYVKKYEELLELAEMQQREAEKISCVAMSEEPKQFDREQLIQELKKFRLEMSRAEGLKPYFIFTDAQMNALIEKKPETKEQLLEVPGFGKAKVEKYGEYIISILDKF